MCVKILDMTTAAAPDGHATDATIRATVRALCSGKGWTVAQLGARIGIPTSSMYYKLNHGFFAAEAADLAAAFGVPISDLYDGLGGRITPDEWAPRDSDPQPTGCRPRHLSLVPQLSELA